MRALIFIDRPAAALAPLDGRYAPALLPIAHQALVRFRLEELIGAGVTDCVFVLCDHADKLEALLGHGERWGARFRFALSRGGEAPSAIWPRINIGDDQPLLVLRADLLAAPSVGPFLEAAQGLSGSTLIGLTDDPRASLLLLRPGHADARALLDVLHWSAPAAPAEVDGLERVDLTEVPLNLLDTLSEYHRANLDLVTGRIPGLSADGRELALGLKVGRRAVIAPRSLRQGQAYIGDNSRVSAEAELLGEAVICRDVVVDRAATVSDSVILPHSYIGELVAVNNAIVAQDLLIRVDTGAVLKIADAFLLGRLGGEEATWKAGGVLDRLLGVLLLVLSLPLWLVALIAAALESGGGQADAGGKGGLLRREVLIGNRAHASVAGRVVASDTDYAFTAWRIDTGIPVLATLPRLLALISGDLRPVGVSPLTPEEAEARTEDWQRVRDQAPVGLIGPTQLNLPVDAPFEERLMSDAFYAGQRGTLADLGLLWSGILALFGRRAWQRPGERSMEQAGADGGGA